jgi:hypothetical protein
LALAHVGVLTADTVNRAMSMSGGKSVRFTCVAPVRLVRRPEDEPWQSVGYMTALAITFPLTRRLGMLMGDIVPLAEANRFQAESLRTARIESVGRGFEPRPPRPSL